MKSKLILLCYSIFVGCSFVACGSGSSSGNSTSDSGNLRSLLGVPAHMELPAIPDFNTPTAEKIELGRFLFYDKKLSANQTQSCGSCHFQSLAFADGRKNPVGSTGQVHKRNSQGLGNAVYNATLTWSSDSFVWLEDQIEVPLISDNPIELGITDSVREEVFARFAADPNYQQMFNAAFGSPEVTLNKVIFALASFCRTLITANSPYDRYVQGDKSALTEQQIRGLQLFNGERFECFHCHAGINLSTSYRDSSSDKEGFARPFFNNGLYNVGGDGSYPTIDQGLYDLTLKPQDKGLFRPQSLRNIALTAPYMHDGSIPTLKSVVEHYARGGTLTKSGANAGDGSQSPLKSGLVRGFQATEQEKEDLVAFLHSLTDEEFITNPKFANPFAK